ncbi:MAG: hypothetical protein IKC23_10300 [Fibrobacter sp.]|nr:hypothetical protein [Fibrobacter sp.]
MKRFLLGSVLALSFSLLSCNDNSSSGPDKREGVGIEVPCNAENEGEVVSPADSDKEYICKNSSWNVVDSSRHCEDCKDETIAISSSSSNNNVILSASDKSSSSIITSVSDESSSSVIASETKQSSSEQSTESSSSEDGDSSSSVETTEDESSSSEETEESSSSEETSMFLCDDGVTYVLDLANCEVESSSSEDARESSSSEATTQSSSENVEESSSSEKMENSSSSLKSSSSDKESSSSVTESSSSNEALAEIKPNGYYESNCPEGKKCEYVFTGYLNQEMLNDDKYGEIRDDRDGQIYKTIEIGTQIWMAQNMNYKYSPTGSGICPGCKSICWNCKTYGVFYKWSAAVDSMGLFSNDGKGCGYKKICNITNVRGVCPKGWRLPQKRDYDELFEFIGDAATIGQKLKSKEEPHFKDNGTDEFGFSGVATGSWGRNTGIASQGAYTAPCQGYLIFIGEIDYENYYYRYNYGSNKENLYFSLTSAWKDESFTPVRCIKN